MYAEPEAWQRLLDQLARVGGDLPAGADRRRRLRRPAVRLLGRRAVGGRLRDAGAAALPGGLRRAGDRAAGERDVPRIHFGVGTGELLPLIGDAGADVVGVDWRIPLDEAARRVGPGLLAAGQPRPGRAAGRPGDRRRARCAGCVEQGRAARGHIFNLGHGVLPDTDPGALTHVVELVHELSRRG